MQPEATACSRNGVGLLAKHLQGQKHRSFPGRRKKGFSEKEASFALLMAPLRRTGEGGEGHSAELLPPDPWALQEKEPPRPAKAERKTQK